MPSRITWRSRALLSLAVLAATTYLLLTTAPRLGLDLRGGTQLVLETSDSPIGVLFVLGALLVLGDGSLADFALALVLGLVIGTVSTVTTAGPAAILLDRRWPGAGRPTQKKERQGSGAVV